MAGKIKTWLNGFWGQIHQGQIVRRIAFFWMMWMTTKAYFWAIDFVGNIETLTADHSLILAAILGPITTLQGAVIKFYAQHPYEQGKDGVNPTQPPVM